MPKRFALGLVILGVLSLPVIGCLLSPANYPKECGAMCFTDDYNRPPTSVGCIAETSSKCQSPTGWMQPVCDDGTPITVSLCQKDGPKCKNGQAPKCVAPPPDAGVDAANDAAAE